MRDISSGIFVLAKWLRLASGGVGVDGGIDGREKWSCFP